MLRAAVSTLLAVVVTGALFFLMEKLIEYNKTANVDEEKGGSIEFVRVEQEQELNTKERERSRPEQTSTPPPPPLTSQDLPPPRLDNLAIGDSVNLDPVDLTEIGGFAVGADTGPIPLVRINPMYPPRASSRGIEGWVIVRFTITAAGTVADPEVIQADPPSVFDREALRAIRRWKYKPKVVDGKPVDQHGIQTLISFELEEDRPGRR